MKKLDYGGIQESVRSCYDAARLIRAQQHCMLAAKDRADKQRTQAVKAPVGLMGHWLVEWMDGGSL